MPREDFRREVEKELTGREEESSELIYFKIYKSQIPVIEQQQGPNSGSQPEVLNICLSVSRTGRTACRRRAQPANGISQPFLLKMRISELGRRCPRASSPQ
jgi:hypothetical protein